jgi:hypothetical protein
LNPCSSSSCLFVFLFHFQVLACSLLLEFPTILDSSFSFPSCYKSWGPQCQKLWFACVRNYCCPFYFKWTCKFNRKKIKQDHQVMRHF